MDKRLLLKFTDFFIGTYSESHFHKPTFFLLLLINYIKM